MIAVRHVVRVAPSGGPDAGSGRIETSEDVGHQNEIACRHLRRLRALGR
jgi:hypothetical protein